MKPRIYVVRYEKNGRVKDRTFRDEEPAHAYYQRKKREGSALALMMVSEYSWWTRLLDARVFWLGKSVGLVHAAFVFVGLTGSAALWLYLR